MELYPATHRGDIFHEGFFGHHKLLKPCLEGTKCLPIFFFCMLLHRSCHPGKAANSLEGELPEIHKYLKVLAKIKSQIHVRLGSDEVKQDKKQRLLV